jgi:EthD domain
VGPRIIYLESALPSNELKQELVDIPDVTRLEQFDALGPGGDVELPDAMFAPGGLSTAFSGVGAATIGEAAGVDALPTAAAAVGRALRLVTGAGDLGGVHPTLAETVFDHGETQLRIFSFLHRQAHLSRTEFSDLWRGFIDTFMAADELRRHCSAYVQNHVPPGAETMFDGIAEMGFGSLADLLAFMSEPSLAQELFPAEAPFIDRTDGVAIMTRPAGVLAGAAVG